MMQFHITYNISYVHTTQWETCSNARTIRKIGVYVI
jgi:hypothetical protein